MIRTKTNLIKVVFIVLLSLLMMSAGIAFLCSEISTPPAQMEEGVDDNNAALGATLTVELTIYGSPIVDGSRTIGCDISGTAGANNKSFSFTAGSTANQYTVSGLTWKKGSSIIGSDGTVITETLYPYQFSNVDASTFSSGLRSSDGYINEGYNTYLLTSASSVKGSFSDSSLTPSLSEDCTIYHTPQYTWDLNGGNIPNIWVGNNQSAVSVWPLIFTFNTKDNTGSTIYPYADYFYSSNPANGNAIGGTGGYIWPERSGYTFNGFWTEKTGGTQVISASATNSWLIDRGSTYCQPMTLYAQWLNNNGNEIYTNLRGGTTYTNIITPSTISESWTASTSYANYMTLAYDAPSGVYTMTNTAAGNDPYATGNQTVYLSTGKTYVMHAICTDNSGVSVTGNPLQVFYGISRGYSEANSKRFGETTTQEFTVSTSGTYNFRFDNDFSYASGGVMKVREFWVAEKSQSTATQTYVVPAEGYYQVAAPTRTGYTFAGWKELLNSTTNITLSTSTSNFNYLAMLTGVVPGTKYEITIGTAQLTSGSATQFATIIYDFTTSKTLASATNKFGSNVSYTLTCPSSATASNDIRIIVYAGINGATANNATSYSNIQIFSNNVLGSYSALQSPESGSKTYYAQWLPVARKVTYNPNGGSISSGNATDYVTYGATYAGKTNIYRPIFNSLALTSSGNILSVNTNNSSGSSTAYANFMTSYDGATVQPSTTYTVVIKVTAFSGNAFTINFTSPYDVGSTGLGDTTTATCGFSITGTGLYVKTFTTKSNLNGSYRNFRSYIPVNAGNKAIATFQVAVFAGPLNSNPTNSTFEYHEAASGNTLPVATRSGYTFAGWYTAQTGGTRVSADTVVTNASDHVLYAHWTANTYTITADANGGTNAAKTGWTLASDSKKSTMNFTYGQPASEMPIASRTGHTCNGWYTATSGGTKVANADGTFLASISGYTDASKNWVRATNTTLYAQWGVNNYDLLLVPNGGYYESSNANRTYSGAYGSTQYFGMPLRTGYTFEGYTLTGSGTLSERKASSGYTSATLKSDANGPYYNYTFSGTRPSENSWPNIQYPTYSFTAGKTYVLCLKIKVNSTTDSFSIRHASISNDWVCPMRTFSGSTNGWVDVMLEQTIGENYTRSGTSYTSSPRLEIYMGSTKATGSNGTTYKVDFDIKNIVIYEKGTGETAFSSIAYTYGAGTGTLTAKWQVKNYSVSIDPNGGTYSGSTTATSVSGNYETTTTISDPTRTGYTFAGWIATKTDLSTTWAQILYHDAVYGTSLFTSGDNLASNVVNTTTKNSQFATLAKLNLTSYEFLLEYHHTLQTGNSMYARAYNRWKQTSNPATTYNSISGYEAVSISWSDNAWGGIAKSSTTASTFIDGSPGTGTWFYALGAYAAWNGGIPGPSAAEKQVTRLWLKTDSTLSNLRPTASFHNDDALGSSNYYYFKDESVTLKALWIINNYTLTANANGGSIPTTSGWTGTGATATKTVTYNAAYGTLPVPTKTGYGFAGWWTQASGGTQVSATTKMGAADTTIYAHWTISSYTLTADCYGGTAPSSLPTGWTANGQQPYRTLNYQSEYGTLPEPTRQGYIFAGWFTAASGGSEVNSNTKMGAENATIYARWVDSWVKDMSNGNPVIDQADGYYIIDSAEKLARLAYLVNYNIDNGKWASYQYKQTADINLSAHYWQPIGNATHPFKGTYDGTTFDIHNMKTYCGANDYEAYNGVGMFGKISGATIKNVNNYYVNIKGRQRTGAIAGRDDLSTIQNCRVTGSVSGIAGYIGGLVGASYKEKVIECENKATVKGDFDVGGIVGNANETAITNCVNLGIIQGRNATGGIAGYKHYDSVVNCINSGNVTGSGQYIGGIVGSYAGAKVQNSINEGTIQGTTMVGGIVGYMHTGAATILNGLNTGTLKATAANSEVGGIAGRVTYATTITSSFVDCSITPVSTSKVGVIVGNTTVATTITYCGAKVNVTAAASTVQPFYSADSGVTVTCNDSYSLVNNNGTQVNRITATNSGMDGKFGMVSTIHDGLPVPLGIYHTSQYGTTTGIASTLKGSPYGCTTA